MKKSALIGLAFLLVLLLMNGMPHAQQAQRDSHQANHESHHSDAAAPSGQAVSQTAETAHKHGEPSGEPGTMMMKCPRMAAHHGMMGGPEADQGDGWYCPWCGRGQGMGMKMASCPKMMGQKGMVMQHGGHTMAASGETNVGEPLSEDKIKSLVEDYLKSTNNPNIKLGKVINEGDKDYYTADVTTQSGELVDKILVHKYSGWFKSGYAK